MKKERKEQCVADNTLHSLRTADTRAVQLTKREIKCPR